MKRRDLLAASKLLARHKMDRTDPAALSLATAYLAEKAEGETDLPFDQWLDEDVDDDEILGDADEDEGEADPT